MGSSSSFGILSGIASALVWGTGDFVGGVAARRASLFGVVALSAIPPIVLMIPISILAGEPSPSAASMAWSLAAGLSGAVGIAALYRGLSSGAAAIVAPTSAVVGTAVPVFAGFLLQSLPDPADLAGILMGVAGIWLVSSLGRSPGPTDRSSLSLGLIAGVGFGGFFVLIAQVEPGVLFSSVFFVKLAAFAFGLVALALRRERLPSLRANPLALVSGMLDTGGNLLFLVAVRATSLAIASVLASMYPAVTVALTILVFRETVQRRQVAGLAMCVGAVILISA